jgi:hypothetical protein
MGNTCNSDDRLWTDVCKVVVSRYGDDESEKRRGASPQVAAPMSNPTPAAQSAPNPAVPNAATVPADLQGTWVIKRGLPIDTGVGCFGEKEISSVVDTVIEYKANSIRWKDHTLAVNKVTETDITEKQFLDDWAPGSGTYAATFRDLGIQGNAVREIAINHRDVDLGWGDDSLPGDHVYLKTPTTLLQNICNVWFEAEKQ